MKRVLYILSLLALWSCSKPAEPKRNIYNYTNAMHALRVTEANDRAYVCQTDDSLILIAVEYFTDDRAIDLKARAHYQWAGIFRNRQEYSEALGQYAFAERLARIAGEYSLLGRIYNNMANLYFRQSLDQKADSLYQLSLQIGTELRDTSLQAEALYMQGKIKLYEGAYPEAERKLQAAIDVLGTQPRHRIRAAIAATQSELYAETEQYGKAIGYARQYLLLQNDSLQLPHACLLLGDAYFKAEQYDSAEVYIRRSLATDIHSVKAGAYMRLADLAALQGDTARSLEMERLYSAHKDSMALNRQAGALIEKEQELKLARQRANYESARRRSFTYYIIGLVACIGLLTYVIRRYYIRRMSRLSIHHNKASLDARRLLESLPAYAKIRQMEREQRWQDSADTQLTDADWQQLTDAMDKCRDRLLSRIALEYRLTPVETHLCLLLMLGLNKSQCALVLRCTRPTVYKLEKSVLAKMERPLDGQKLNKVLSEIG